MQRWVLIIMTVAFWCGTATAEPMVLRRGSGPELDTFDPAKSHTLRAARIFADLFETLVTLDAAEHPVPAAAERWDVSPDGLVYNFHLRRGLVWSDGSPLTADDFLYAFRRVVTPSTKAGSAFLLYPVKNAQDIAEGRLPDATRLGIEAVDAGTLRFTLTHPAPYWVALMARPTFSPVKRANIEAYGDAFTEPGKLISNGPFLLQSWTPGTRLILSKNPHYWDAAKVRLDQIILYPIHFEAEELTRYLAGDLDVTSFVPFRQIDNVGPNMAREWRTEPSMTLQSLSFNMVNSPFAKNPALRQAVSMAIDRETLVAKVVKVGTPVAYGAVPASGIPNYVEQPVEWAWLPTADKIDKARQLYREAGYGADNPLQIEILVSDGDNSRSLGAAISAQLQQVLGVKVTLSAMEPSLIRQHQRKREGGAQLFWHAWTGDYPDASTFLGLFTSSSTNNLVGYSNPRYDALIVAAEKEADLGRHNDLLQQAEQLLMSENPIIPLYTRSNSYLVKPWVKGVHANPSGDSYDREIYLLPH